MNSALANTLLTEWNHMTKRDWEAPIKYKYKTEIYDELINIVEKVKNNIDELERTSAEYESKCTW